MLSPSMVLSIAASLFSTSYALDVSPHGAQGIAGGVNSVRLSGAVAGDTFLFFAAAEGGNTAIPRLGAELALADPTLLGLAQAGPDGVAHFDFRAPDVLGALQGHSLQLQALSTQTHATSSVAGMLFPGIIVVDFEEADLVFNTQISLPEGTNFESSIFSFFPLGLNSGLNDLHIGNGVDFWGFNGTHVLAGHDQIHMSKIDNGRFTLLGFDLAGFPNDFEVPFDVISSNGTSVSFTPDGLSNGLAGGDDFESFTLPHDGFSNVTSVTFRHAGDGTFSGSFHLDNLIVTRPQFPGFGAELGSGAGAALQAVGATPADDDPLLAPRAAADAGPNKPL